MFSYDLLLNVIIAGVMLGAFGGALWPVAQTAKENSISIGHFFKFTIFFLA